VNRDIALHHLVGRMVHDAAGRRLGRIEELCAEIELHERGNDYVVTEYHVGSFGALEALTGSRFARLFLRHVGRVPHRVHRIRWDQLDLSDASHPRLRE
jgi:hypothetical protein